MRVVFMGTPDIAATCLKRILADGFEVVGVYGARVEPDTPSAYQTDNFMILPYTATRLLGDTAPTEFLVKAKDDASMKTAITEIGGYLSGVVDQSMGGYQVQKEGYWQDYQNQQLTMISLVLGGIAAISLLVGGIGIMNIMLVSVTERTREIGIRKALGAKERVILSQFVVEAATTSALGGVLGIVLGYIVSMAANHVLPMISSDIDVTVSPSFNSIAVAFGISVFIGVLFGYLPAKRAARLNPIEALRYD